LTDLVSIQPYITTAK